MKNEKKYREINASFGTIADVMTNGFIEQFLEVIEKYADHFGIVGYRPKHNENLRLKPIDKKVFVEELWRPTTRGRGLPWVHFGGSKRFSFEISIRVCDGKILKDRYDMTDVTMFVDRSYFTTGSETQQSDNLFTFLSLCKDIYHLTKPLCGDCHDIEDEHAIRASLSRRGLFRFLNYAYSTEYGHVEQLHIDCPMTGIYWANFLGPSCVNFFGYERLLKAPGVIKREDLDGGGMLLFTAPHPLTPDDPVHRANQIALWDYLGFRPSPNLKVIAKYKSSNPWEGAKPSFNP
jgi:hypothetical protein